jgi:hypothetical protein
MLEIDLETKNSTTKTKIIKKRKTNNQKASTKAH